VPGGDGGAPITGFELRYSESADFAGGGSTLNQNGGTRNATINGLTNFTTYYLSIRATNAAGFTSPWSNAVAVTPCGAPPPTTLTNARLQLSTAGVTLVIALDYTCPAALPPGIPQPTLTAEKSTDGVTWTQFANLMYSAGTSVYREVSSAGFNGAARTQVRLRTTVDGCGSSVSDEKVVVNPPCAVARTTISAGARCTGSINVSWLKPTNAGCAPTTGYRIACAAGTGAFTTSSTTYTGTTGTYSPVYNGLAYKCYVIAYNEGGETAGTVSNSIAVTVSTAAGYAPIQVGAVTGSTIDITWTAAFEGAGAYVTRVTGYKLYIRPTNNKAAETMVSVGRVTAYTFTGLNPTTAYEFKVIAVNACGDGPGDWSASGTTTGLTPNKPTLTATPTGACSPTSAPRVTLEWSATVDAGLAPITGYTLEQSLNGVTWTALTTINNVSVTTYIDTNVTPQTTYYYRVFARNAAGASPPSTVAVVVTDATVPSAPQNFTATPGNGNATLNWSAPATIGAGGGVALYVIKYKLSTAASWSTAASGNLTSPYTLTGLTNKSLYNIEIRAQNGTCKNISGAAATTTVTPFDPNCTCPAAPYNPVGFGCAFAFPVQTRNTTITVDSGSAGFSGRASRTCDDVCNTQPPQLLSCVGLGPDCFLATGTPTNPTWNIYKTFDQHCWYRASQFSMSSGQYVPVTYISPPEGPDCFTGSPARIYCDNGTAKLVGATSNVEPTCPPLVANCKAETKSRYNGGECDFTFATGDRCATQTRVGYRGKLCRTCDCYGNPTGYSSYSCEQCTGGGSATLKVDSQGGWTSAVAVNVNDEITVTAIISPDSPNGRVEWAGANSKAGPDGVMFNADGTKADCANWLNDAVCNIRMNTCHMALIGSFDGGNTTFLVGSSYTGKADKSGTLTFRMNDKCQGDNKGTYSVTYSVTCGRTLP
jgi:hypothetical protein